MRPWRGRSSLLRRTRLPGHFEGRTGGRTGSQDPRFLARLTHGFKPFPHGQRGLDGRCRLQSRLQTRTFAQPGPAPRSAPGSTCRALGALSEQGAMVDLAVVEQDVRVDVARHARGALPDERSDLGPARSCGGGGRAARTEGSRAPCTILRLPCVARPPPSPRTAVRSDRGPRAVRARPRARRRTRRADRPRAPCGSC